MISSSSSDCNEKSKIIIIELKSQNTQIPQIQESLLPTVRISYKYI